VFLLFILSLPNRLLADGTYYVGRDDGGVYFQTDQDGGWYIDISDLRYFKIGQTGTYSIKRDKNGTYLITDEKKKYYLDTSEKDQLENEIADYNKKQSNTSSQQDTKVIIKGNQVLVPVTIGYSGKKIEGQLLLDTGASIITLHRNFVKKLKIKTTQKARLMVVGGETIIADAVKLDFIEVGNNKKKDLYSVIVDHNGPAVSHSGLLGMNFLRYFEYHVDFEKQIIRWVKK
jgi:predicted aspartyl protease